MGRIRDRASFHIILSAIVVAAVFTFSLLCIFLPLNRSVAVGTDTYRCVWANGDVTEETYEAACKSIRSVEQNKIILSRENETGTVEVSGEFSEAFGILESGSLAELLSLHTEGLNRLEHAALWAFGDWIYYSEEAFAFDGDTVSRTDRTSAETVALVSGELPEGYLIETNVKTLVLFEEAILNSSDLINTAVEQVVAHAPYTFEGGAVYYHDAIVSLIAALPNVKTLTVQAADFYNAGALAACKQLEELTLPFIGREGAPHLGSLFGRDGEDRFVFPDCLKKVTVTGGKLFAHAFYGCTGLEEIDVSALPAGSIEENAFSGCSSLIRLKTAEEVELPETFDCTREGEFYIYQRRKS